MYQDPPIWNREKNKVNFAGEEKYRKKCNPSIWEVTEQVGKEQEGVKGGAEVPYIDLH